MGYDSIRNKALVEFPNGKLLLMCEISDSRTFDCHGKRCWDRTLFHPKGTLFYTKETLKAEQTAYVERQINNMREFNRLEVERGYATEYIEPTVESYDYNGTRWPGGCRKGAQRPAAASRLPRSGRRPPFWPARSAPG